MVLAPLSASFQPLPPSKLCPSGADSRVVGLCTFWDPVGLSNKLFCEAGIFSCCHLNPQGVFNQWFEALFPHTGALGCAVCFIPPLFLPVYLHANVGPLGPPATASQGLPAAALPVSCINAHPAPQSTASLGPPVTTLLQVLSTQLRVSTPSTSLDECGFFISLVVGLPYSSILCQFWLVFFCF